SYLKAKELNLEDYDAGSLYFVIIDGLKAELVDMYPDEDEVIINSTCESIFVKYFSQEPVQD
ncbi:MAG: hypothetical protein PF505_12845, partial [Vallitaleaceae bacterium]|nr:hypothetical protein [Vallitaleaceae bacterium]